MFKTILVPTKVFDTDIIKPKAKAIYFVRDEHYCPITYELLEYKSYEGIIDTVYDDNIRFISDDTHVNLYTDSEHPDIDKWLSVEDIDGYWVKLELI